MNLIFIYRSIQLLILIASIEAADDYLKNNDDRIVGGVAASIGEFKFQVSFRKNNNHFCGGSIITPSTMISAAHCFTNQIPENVTAVVGTNTLNSGGVVNYPDKFILHERYDGKINDVALVIFNKGIRLNKYAQVIRLPSKVTGGGVIAIASGWGRSSNNNTSLPNDLQKLEFETLDDQECERLTYGVIKHKICVFARVGSGVCYGDSGGPLSKDGELIGIAAYISIKLCASGYPDVYTRVSSFIEWINFNKL